MAAYEVLLLNTAVPQIQAAQSGDTYVVPRDIAFSTVASFAAGSEATPSIVATGDANTGIWFPAADTVAISTGGISRLRLDSSGNLGLGVTPTGKAKLEVYTGAGDFAGISTRYNASNLPISFGIANANGVPYFGVNARQVSGTDGQTYDINGFASRMWCNGGGFAFFTAPSGTAGAAISFTQAMTLDASGRLGIGPTSVEEKLHISAANPTNGIMQYVQNTSTSSQTGAKIKLDVGNVGTSGLGIPDGASNALAFFVGGMASGSERARITSGGDLLVGDTATSAYFDARANFYSPGTYGAFAGKQGGAAGSTVGVFWHTATTGDNSFSLFVTEGAGAQIVRGSIDYDRAGGLVRYNTTSDYRAKDILGPLQNVGATIDALKVYEGVMKGATRSRPMLIAHETQEHAPYAVSGVKDEMNEDGTPKYQQMDVSSLVPLLLAEIQSLRARVAQLEQGA